jgi:hypothetical protein
MCIMCTEVRCAPDMFPSGITGIQEVRVKELLMVCVRDNSNNTRQNSITVSSQGIGSVHWNISS